MANLGTLVAVSFLVAVVLAAVGSMARMPWVERISDLAFVTFYVSAGALVWAFHGLFVDRVPLVWLFTLLAIAALAVQLVNQVLVAVGVFKFPQVAILQTVAFAGVLVWMAAVSIMTFGDDALPVGIGWLGVITVLGAVALLGLMSRDKALVRGERNPTRNELIFAVLPLLALLAWFYWVGSSV